MPFPYAFPFAFSSVTAAENAYAQMLRQLMPRGAAWLLEPGSWISKTLLALAVELARVGERGEDFIEETDPRTATETLDEWETMMGLPDDAIETIPVTDAARRLAITQKIVVLPDMTPQGFIDLAAECGYTVTIYDSYSDDLFRSGRGRSGDRVYGAPWVNVFLIEVSAPAGTALSHAELEAVIRRAAPAHTYVSFEYL